MPYESVNTYAATPQRSHVEIAIILPIVGVALIVLIEKALRDNRATGVSSDKR